MFATGTDTQVGTRQAGQRQPLGEQLFVDIVDRQLPRHDLGGQRAAGLHDVPSAAVADRDHEVEAAVAGGRGLRLGHQALQVGVEAAAVADDTQADVILLESIQLGAQQTAQQLHEQAHFGTGSLQIFSAQAKQCQRCDTAAGARFRDRPHAIRAGPMTGGAAQVAGLGPAPVAVHDDCDVRRGQQLRIERTAVWRCVHRSVLRRPSVRLLCAAAPPRPD